MCLVSGSFRSCKTWIMLFNFLNLMSHWTVETDLKSANIYLTDFCTGKGINDLFTFIWKLSFTDKEGKCERGRNEKRRENQRENYSICWSTPQRASMARVELIGSQDSGTSFQVSQMDVGAQVLEPSCTAFPCHKQGAALGSGAARTRNYTCKGYQR